MKKILITGGSGYVGAMLAHQFSKREDIESVLLIDKDDQSDICKNNSKIKFIKANLCNKDDWFDKVRDFSPEIVIHTAWQIREMYGKKDLQWKWNVCGSDNIFDFVFDYKNNVKKLIHFSTVASYGAFSENSIDHRFVEEENFRKTDYLYAEEKRIVEEHLKDKYEKAKSFFQKDLLPQVFVLRPASITGPRGRYMRIKFGLQSALSGQLKKGFFEKIISLMVSFVPITEKWCRQFIHEDDVADIVSLLSFNDLNGNYEIFNICPPGEIVTGKEMAQIVNKKFIKVSPQIIRFAFFIMRHISLGKVPTSRGSWRTYSYPIAVDGSKITKKYRYNYKFNSKEAFIKKEGRYIEYLNQNNRI